jgi:hypothetical protein
MKANHDTTSKVPVPRVSKGSLDSVPLDDKKLGMDTAG